MKTAYISEFGIRPWESARPTNDVKFVTTTLINHSFSNLWRSWCEIMEPLVEWRIKREWRAATGAAFNSRTEEYLYKKNKISTLNSGDLFKKNEISNIYSTIRNLPSSPKNIDNLALEGSHGTLIIMEKNGTDIEQLWDKMKIFEDRITPEKISIFLESQLDTMLCRFYDSETHAAAQFFYATNGESRTLLNLIEHNFNQLRESEICNYINNTHTNRSD
ncbi:hypothetical protein [Pseudomonas sp. R3-18-08]|uniref:hypothetical protein n=1 Tax=Pseudomonas sp. R3-18-08 TaxID=1173283 RepID=UPI000F58AC90|nr:hypothetical protein [Pseudomonas sp. R3-18-08]AZF18125.1 hypothetical protein C4J92_4679 [Pseudomonas sp. R3-18-08]